MIDPNIISYIFLFILYFYLWTEYDELLKRENPGPTTVTGYKTDEFKEWENPGPITVLQAIGQTSLKVVDP